MAEVIYRLPGKEPYSYAEVKLTHDELFGPDALSGEDRVALLQETLSDLEGAYPNAPERPQAAPQSQPGNPKTTCVHGPRKHSKGQSNKGPWQAYFCSQPKGSQCEAVWLKQGDPEWIN